MSVALRVLDDGAWISVNDERRVSVGELWRFPDPTFCACSLPDAVVEGFLETGVDGRTVRVRAAAQCIACGESGTTGWLPVGRVGGGEFRSLARESVLAPAGVHGARPDEDGAAGSPGDADRPRGAASPER
jgi:hypothetical protein